MDSTWQAYQHRPLTIKLWPPSQSTRLMLVERMTKNLTTPSIFSRKYGLLSKEEAEEDAKHIENVAFATATQHFEKEPDGDGSSAVQIYAKESSKLMLEALKRGPKAKEDGELINEKAAGATAETVFDISGGRRDFISGEETAELLKPLTGPSSYNKICFSNRSFGLDAARVAVKHGSGYTIYPRSSFTINCTGDVCMGDVVLFRQKVYEKFHKVTRHGKTLGNRTVAGRVVKESYGAAKQQHTFTVEVLWSSGVRKLPPLSPLLVKGRNLYKQKTYRQRWKNEADRIEVLSEKHKRGAAARSMRSLKRKKKSCSANESKGSKWQHEIHNKKR